MSCRNRNLKELSLIQHEFFVAPYERERFASPNKQNFS